MRHPDLKLHIPPNLAEMGADAREFQKILAKLDRFAAERRQVSGELHRFWSVLEHAKRQDSEAYAQALQSGKKPPEPEHERKAEEEKRALERKLDALGIVVEKLRTDARAHIEEHREDWRKQSDGALERARKRYEDAITEVVEARGSFYATWQALEWLRDPTRKFNPKGGEAPVTLNLDKHPGAVRRQQVQVTPILAAMRFELGAPERKAKENTVFLVDERDGEAREVG